MLEQLTSFCLIASLKSSLNCFSYYFSDSCSLSFLLFSPFAPIDVTSTWPQGLIDLSQFIVSCGYDLQTAGHLPLYTTSNSIPVYRLSEVGCLTTSLGHNETMWSPSPGWTRDIFSSPATGHQSAASSSYHSDDNTKTFHSS